MAQRAVLSVNTKPGTRDKLEALARATSRTTSALASEALEQYLSHQEWLVREIDKGLAAADTGELVEDEDVEAWFRSIGVAS